MRVLVTGGGGFIGQATCSALNRRGHQFVTFDHPDDVRDRGAVMQAVARVDGVIHLAGLLGTAETLDEGAKLVDVNVLGALNVADACELHDVPMVQIGTGHRGQLNVYAITKACAEDLVLARAEWGCLRANVVRAFHAYGPGQKAPPPYGSASVRKIIPAFVCAALAGDPLRVNGDGRQQIDLVHVDDVAVALCDALLGPYGRTIEAGTGVAVSVLQAALDVVEACGSSSEIVTGPMRPGEPLWSRVVADDPHGTPRPWPSLDDTIAYYRRLLSVAA